ncbi:uncharacterized protein JCM10292_003082 [Rhodotorula paludigena]|uniref:uncharacterized protein n=1 Tax=Rhodotorula paludigena TaxID=86838 RepID=UPI00317E9473
MADTGAIPSVRTLVWLAVKPLIRIFFPASVGFGMQKAGMLPADATRASAIILINFLLPCLLFSKIVPSFNGDNVSVIGPILLTAFFYQLFPGVLGLFGRALTPSPRQFRHGIISAYAFGNWGDLPTAVVLSVTSTSPFSGGHDETLGIAYCSVFILVVYLSTFPLQGIRLIQMDYERELDTARELRYEDGEFGTAAKYWNRLRHGCPMKHELEEERQRQRKRNDDLVEEKEEEGAAEAASAPGDAEAPAVTRATEDQDEITALDAQTADFPAIEPIPSRLSARSQTRPPSVHPTIAMRVAQSIWTFLRPVITSPPTMTLLCALVIALIPVLRALFIAPDGTESFHPTAPDGDPPLAVLYDAASFVGAASIPTGLIILGASIGKISLPKPLSRLPISGILAMAFTRLVILPIVGFFFVRQLVKSGMIDGDNHVLRFVMVLYSCVPTATNQVTFSILFAPKGRESNADLVSAYLLVEYAIWAISSVILTAFSLNAIFS